MNSCIGYGIPRAISYVTWKYRADQAEGNQRLDDTRFGRRLGIVGCILLRMIPK